MMDDFSKNLIIYIIYKDVKNLVNIRSRCEKLVSNTNLVICGVSGEDRIKRHFCDRLTFNRELLFTTVVDIEKISKYLNYVREHIDVLDNDIENLYHYKNLILKTCFW